MSSQLRSALIRLAHERPEFRGELLPMLKEAAPGDSDDTVPSEVVGAARDCAQLLQEAMGTLRDVQDQVKEALQTLRRANSVFSDEDSERLEKELYVLINNRNLDTFRNALARTSGAASMVAEAWEELS